MFLILNPTLLHGRFGPQPLLISQILPGRSNPLGRPLTCFLTPNDKSMKRGWQPHLSTSSDEA